MATQETRRFVVAKKKYIRYQTVEIYHPAFGVYRLVADQERVKSFTLESDAPRNPSETVEFQPATMIISEPELTDGVTGRTITFSRIGEVDIKSLIKSIDPDNGDYIKQIEVVYRTYIDSTLSPANVPEILYGSIAISGSSATLTVSDENPVSVRGAIIQSVDKFGTLRGFI